MKDLKQKVFGLYIWQKIACTDARPLYGETRDLQKVEISKANEDWYLVVTPLSMITDEHAIEVAKIHCGQQYVDMELLRINYNPTLKKGIDILFITFKAFEVTRFEGDVPKQFITAINTIGNIHTYVGAEISNNEKSVFICDFLRSKGYALPAFGHSVDSLISQGIFKLKEA